MAASRWIPVVLVLALADCASLGRGSQARRAAECDSLNLPDSSFLARYKPEGAQLAYQDYAELAYLYAQLADNAYPRRYPWVLPDSVRLERSVDDSARTGFAAKVFELGPRQPPRAVVIAFRGTEGPFLISRDWRFGNWTIRQQLQAESLFVEVRKKYPSTPIIATGHSLGGALALQLSIWHDSIPAYVFNASYRVIHRGRDSTSYRVSFAETGEILRIVRAFLPNMDLLHLRGFDCTEGNAIRNHGMGLLARCFTRIAAAELPDAAESLRLNRVTCTNGKPVGPGTASIPAVEQRRFAAAAQPRAG